MLSPTPSVSIIIPALNEERFVGACLCSLTRLKYPRDCWEVIVVDNGSTDQTLEIVRSFQTELKLRVIHEPGARVSGVRNVGARVAHGERLIFLDADCVVPPEWLERAARAARSSDALLLGARFRVPEKASWVARVWCEYEQRAPEGPVSYLSAHNLHINREDFWRLGGFDETLDSNEDYEFSQRVRAAGDAIQDCPELAVQHLGNAETLKAFFRRERWHGRDVLRVFLRDIRRRHNFRAVAFAAYTLACLLALAAGMASTAVSGTPSMIAVAGLLAVVGAPLALGFRAAVTVRKARLGPALALLFLVYAVARAIALLDPGRVPQRKLAKVAVSR